MKNIFYSIAIISLFISCNQKGLKTQPIETVEPVLEQYTLDLKHYAYLPKVCDESSGLEFIDSKIVTMNDSGGDASLYSMYKRSGDLVYDEIEILNSKNVDWESLATDENHIYIADFGNNLGNRLDLTVYQVEKVLSKKSLKAEIIEFEYENQTDFSNQNRAHSFDAEAMFVDNEHIIFFSKDWAGRSTQVYHLPISGQAKHRIAPKESLQIDALITGADYNAQTKQLILCGYENYVNYIWIFEKSSFGDYLTEDYKRIELKGLEDAQVEGITFQDNHTILISTEKTKLFQQQLWTIEL